MSTLTVTAKGQVTLRKELLRHLGVGPGEKVEIELLPNGRAELRAVAKRGSIENTFSRLHKPGTKALSIEEMNEIIANAWAGKR